MKIYQFGYRNIASHEEHGFEVISLHFTKDGAEQAIQRFIGTEPLESWEECKVIEHDVQQ